MSSVTLHQMMTENHNVITAVIIILSKECHTQHGIHCGTFMCSSVKRKETVYAMLMAMLLQYAQETEQRSRRGSYTWLKRNRTPWTW